MLENQDFGVCHENESDLRRLQGDRRSRAEIRSFSSFCTANPLGHVPDPYYGGTDGFERVADIVEDGCQGLLKHLRTRFNKDNP